MTAYVIDHRSSNLLKPKEKYVWFFCFNVKLNKSTTNNLYPFQNGFTFLSRVWTYFKKSQELSSRKYKPVQNCLNDHNEIYHFLLKMPLLQLVKINVNTVNSVWRYSKCDILKTEMCTDGGKKKEWWLSSWTYLCFAMTKACQ